MIKKVLLFFLIFILNINVYALDGQKINNPNTTSQELKVLVIEINPVLNSITLNGKNPKVSEYLGHDVNKSINEIKKDFNDSSNGYIKVNIVKKEYLNEFPTYLNDLKLIDGSYSKKYDEKTYLSMFNINPNGTGDWFSMLSNDYFKQVDSIGAGNFDYDYLIKKFDLINRKNKKEFDQVWIFNISPIGTYETMMVGKTSYWINGLNKTYNCDNFVIVGFEIARQDSMFHSIGHMTEQILARVFGQSKDIYSKSVYNINSKEDYQKLNLWEKFSLTSFNNNSNYTSVGNTHFPYNASSDYDYDNTTKVKTNYMEWVNYPNVTGDTFVLSDNSNFIYSSINRSVLDDQNQTKANDRLYQRFWFSLLPHIKGYTKDGYLNNWWKYLYSLDYVESIKSNDNTSISLEQNNIVNVDYDIIYHSNKKENFKTIIEGNNVSISNKNVLDFKDEILYSKGIGKSSVTIYYDGKSITYNVDVYKSESLTESKDEDVNNQDKSVKEEANNTNILVEESNEIIEKNNEVIEENNEVIEENQKEELKEQKNKVKENEYNDNIYIVSAIIIFLILLIITIIEIVKERRKKNGQYGF